MKHFAILAASTALGFMSDMTEVVLATRKGHDGPVRVNKSDFDADQAKDAGDREYGKYSGKTDLDQPSVAGAQAFDAMEGVRVQAAPSAPDFSGSGQAVKPVIDEEKNAIAPTIPSETSRLVMKEGKTFFIVDGMGTKLTSEVAGGEVDETGYKSDAAARAAIAALPR